MAGEAQFNVGGLTQALSEAGARVKAMIAGERQLSRELTGQVRAAEAATSAAVAALQPETAQRLAELQAKSEADQAQVRERQAVELARMQERCDACEAAVAAHAEGRIGAVRGEYQQTAWRAKNELDAKRSAAKEAEAELAEEIAVASASLGQCRKRARRWLRGYAAVMQPVPDDGEGLAAVPETNSAGRDLLASKLAQVEETLTALEADGSARHFATFGATLWTVVVALLAGGGVFGLWRIGALSATTGGIVGGAAVVVIAMIATFATLAKRRVAGVGAELAVDLALGEALVAWLPESMAAMHAADIAARGQELDVEVDEMRSLAQELVETIIEPAREQRLARVVAFRERELAAMQARQEEEAPSAAAAVVGELASVEQESSAEMERLRTVRDEQIAAAEVENANKVAELQRDWANLNAEIRREIDDWRELAASAGASWQEEGEWANWDAPEVPLTGMGFGRLVGETAQIFPELPDDSRLRLDLPATFELPAALAFPDRCNLLIEGRDKARPQALDLLQAVVMRLLTRIPPGQLRLTFVDPVGLGQTFAGFMHLADHDESLVGGRIWTDERQIDACLTDLTEHMETVIQKYLRNEYESIADYNLAAGEIAEPYRVLVIADLPVNFSEAAVRRLMSIADSGARCGVYVVAFWDVRHPKPPGFSSADFRKSGVHLTFRGDGLAWRGEGAEQLTLVTDEAPAAALQSELLREIGEASSRRARVMVPFASVAPSEAEAWSLSSAEELVVPIGQSGTRVQSLRLGHGTQQHVLVAGNTGSGKSTLLHVLITNAASWYSPEELRFFLIDFKKGVEFKAYASNDLPHAEAIAIESDRGFGVSVLARVDEILRERGETMRRAGVQGLTAYRGLADREPMPRILLVIDEFQEFFVEEDQTSQDAARLLDRIVRQGRAFGIHVLLGSQTLGGAYSLARATMGQMAVRIALQCSEQDSYLILGEDNTAARLLSRPGEAIYNDQSGAVAGNSPFQVVWLPEEVRDEQVATIARWQETRQCADGGPAFVFEGNDSADARRNRDLSECLAGRGDAKPQLWLGLPNAIKGPTTIRLRSFGGNNVIMIGQREEAARAICGLAAASLAAVGGRVWLLDGTQGFGEASGGFSELEGTVDLAATAGPAGSTEVVAALHGEMVARRDGQGSGAEPLALVVYGLQRFRKLRVADEYAYDAGEGPDQQFLALLRDGPELGIHVIAWCDSLANVNRTLPRRTLGDFDHRILFQMSANDSMNLVDSGAAAKLGDVQAIHHDEQGGTSEIFNPYAMPPKAWLEGIAAARRQGG